MKRFHEAGDQRAINRQFKERRRSLYYGSLGDIPTSKFSTQKGRYRKRHALDCGKPQCKLCHSSKIWDIKTHKQVKADTDFKDQLKDAS